jgi:hypothetical protein
MPSSEMLRRVALVSSIHFIVLHLVVTAKPLRSAPIIVTLMIEAIRSSETSALTRATQRNIPYN